MKPVEEGKSAPNLNNLYPYSYSQCQKLLVC